MRGNQQSEMMLRRKLGRVPGLAVVEAELGADRREAPPGRREVPDALELGGAAQRLALDEPDEVRRAARKSK